MADTKAAHPEGRKQCRPCKELRPLDDFAPLRWTFDALNWRCRACKKEEDAKCRQNNKNRTDEQIHAARVKKYGKVLSTAFKKCRPCRQQHPLADFPDDRATSDGFAGECKACRSKRLNSARAECKEIRDKAREGGCVTCGWNESLVALELSHIDRKDKKRGKDGKPIDPKEMINPDELREELKKCIVECANCHQIKTVTEYEEDKSDTEAAVLARKRLEPYKEFVAGEKMRRGKCTDCGLKVGTVPFSVFDFDHSSPNKVTTVAIMVHDCYPLEEIAVEMAKCDLRCKRCHAIKTHERRKSEAKVGEKRRAQE